MPSATLLQSEDAWSANAGILALLGYAILIAWTHRRDLVRPPQLRSWVTNILAGLTAIPVEYAATSVLLSIILWMIAYRRFKFPAYLVFYYPLSLVLFIVVVMRSFFQTATGTATWKDRLLDRVAMCWL